MYSGVPSYEARQALFQAGHWGRTCDCRMAGISRYKLRSWREPEVESVGQSSGHIMAAYFDLEDGAITTLFLGMPRDSSHSYMCSYRG